MSSKIACKEKITIDIGSLVSVYLKLVGEILNASGALPHLAFTGTCHSIKYGFLLSICFLNRVLDTALWS